MFQKGGFRPFFAGSSATISRDIAFGGTYALLRHGLHLHFLQSPESSYKSDTSQSEDKLISVIEQRRLDTIRFSINMISACVATIVSSPLNYIRNIHYATPPESPQLSVIHVLEELFMQTRQETGYYKQASFFLSRLRIGWGTARVGVGMAFGSEFYYYCSRMTSASASARD